MMAPRVLFGILDAGLVVPPMAVAGSEDVDVEDGIISVLVAMTVIIVTISVLIVLLELCIPTVDNEVEVKEEIDKDFEPKEVEIGRTEVDDEGD
jgi:hypothetical protein